MFSRGQKTLNLSRKQSNLPPGKCHELTATEWTVVLFGYINASSPYSRFMAFVFIERVNN